MTISHSHSQVRDAAAYRSGSSPSRSAREEIREASDVAALVRREVIGWDREQFLVIALDARNKVLRVRVISIGTATACLVHPREVFAVLIEARACGCILAHIHPSGDSSPSTEDLALTRRMRDAGELMGIPLLDHVVVTQTGYESAL